MKFMLCGGEEGFHVYFRLFREACHQSDLPCIAVELPFFVRLVVGVVYNYPYRTPLSGIGTFEFEKEFCFVQFFLKCRFGIFQGACFSDGIAFGYDILVVTDEILFPLRNDLIIFGLDNSLFNFLDNLPEVLFPIERAFLTVSIMV